MSNIREALDKITLESLRKDANARRYAQIVLLIGGPFLAGIGEIASNIIDDSRVPYALIGWGIGVVMIGAGALLLLYLDSNLPQVLIETNSAIKRTEAEHVVTKKYLESACAKIGYLEAQAEDEAHAFERLARLYTLSSTLRELTEPILLSGPGLEDARRDRIGAMLDLLVENKLAYFAIADDRWNFAVYLPNAEGQLECVVCRRPNRNDEQRPHRTWTPGDGHVGRAFQWGQEIVIPDASETVTASLLRGVQTREEDNTVYRSVAALPILADGQALGVLVATSDRSGRFVPRAEEWLDDIDPVEPLRLLAGTLAIVAAVTKVYDSKVRSDL